MIFVITTNPQLPYGEELFRVDYMGIYGLDGRSRAPMDGFMASRINLHGITRASQS